MLLFKAPSPTPTKLQGPTIFLAGTISGWRQDFIDSLVMHECTIFNPVNHDEAVWSDRSTNNPAFKQQLEWEYEAQQKSSIVVFYFDPKTEAPISLLELGGIEYEGMADHVLVCCPKGYKHKGHVDQLCATRAYPEPAETLEEVQSALIGLIETWHGERYALHRENILDNMG
jgi:hypothetical protein